MVTYLKAAKLVDCTGAEAISNAAVIVEDGRIRQVGPASQLPVPEGAQVLDLGSGTLMPGLIDSHLHIGEDCRREETVGQQHLQPDALRAIRAWCRSTTI